MSPRALDLGEEQVIVGVFKSARVIFRRVRIIEEREEIFGQAAQSQFDGAPDELEPRAKRSHVTLSVSAFIKDDVDFGEAVAFANRLIEELAVESPRRRIESHDGKNLGSKRFQSRLHVDAQMQKMSAEKTLIDAAE